MRQSARARGYDSTWHKARTAYIKAHPLCVMCAKAGRTRAACVVDHITPHKGNTALFWNRDNWQALCKHCHDSHKQSHERTQGGCDVNGYPIDEAHDWNRATRPGAV